MGIRAQSIEPDLVELPKLVQDLVLGANEILETLLADSGKLRSHLLLQEPTLSLSLLHNTPPLRELFAAPAIKIGALIYVSRADDRYSDLTGLT